MNCSFLVKFLPDDETLSMNSLTSCNCVKSVLTKHWRNLPCSCFRETLGEEGREELRATRQQAPHLLHRWHEHAGGGRVRDGAAAHDDPPAHGLQPLVLSVIYQTIWHKHTCYDGVPLLRGIISFLNSWLWLRDCFMVLTSIQFGPYIFGHRNNLYYFSCWQNIFKLQLYNGL